MIIVGMCDGCVIMRMIIVRSPMRLAEERHEDETPGIERGEPRRDRDEDEGIGRRPAVARIGRLDDRVLREIAGCQRKAGQRQRAD